MRIATDPDLIDFSDAPTGQDPCGCPPCREEARRGVLAAREEAEPGRIHRAVRATCVATTVLAGAGTVGLGLGAANANAAAGSQGWDGSKYWFKNASGEWRYTSHLSVYQSRTGSSSGGPTNSGGIKQGWDGSRYWFKNAAGEWRWTSHLSVYNSRTGGGSQQPQPQPQPPAPQPSRPGSSSVEAAISYATAQLGKPYIWGGNGPSGYDCSGLVQQAYRRAGVSLPRVADDQYAATTPVTAGQLRRGDLLFWSDSGRASGIHHVGIYLGDNTFLEAARPGTRIRISTLSQGYFPTHLGRP
ncbi:C40 family peptidase [Kitasatospora sp. NPDC051853]|uniref:C40 family peptidase n=1 Tax=Kitasatospora sp. NPDC051853 TaxID=3364058 RepID=UPI0037B4587A